VIDDDHHLQLRAERAGADDGRAYTTTATCADSSGNAASVGALVQVRHDAGIHGRDVP
jgi:hypothetical protein